MAIALVVFLIAPLTAASPLTRTQRSAADGVLSGGSVRVVSDGRSAVEQKQHAPLVKIVPFLSEDKLFELHVVKPRMTPYLRPRRALQRGCQLGTCQLHNLASTLYHISKMSGKEESKKANDPQGYGR